MDAKTNPGLTIRDYAGVLWRRKLIFLSVIILATVAAFLLASRQTRQYSAHATLVYETSIDVTNPLSSSNVDPNERNLELHSVAEEIASPYMKKLAAALLIKRGLTSTDYTVSSSTGTDTKSSIYNNTAMIIASSPDPAVA